MHRGRHMAPVLPVHKSSKRSSEPRRIPALAYVAACFAIGVLIGKALRPQMAEFAPAATAQAPAATNAPTAAAPQKKLDPRVYAFYYAWYQNPATDGLWAHWNHKHLDHWDAVAVCVEIKFYGAFVLNRRVDLHAIAATHFHAGGPRKVPALRPRPG